MPIKSKYILFVGIAQLVERCLAKAKVAGSSPVSHSKKSIFIIKTLFFLVIWYTIVDILIVLGEIATLNKDILHMKSVIVQGATIAKAIDEALVKAGMPAEFFIKVLEEALPGFLGFGSKKAKIALFFKKEQNRREGSLLSRGSYKDLFNNENLLAQSVEQTGQDKVVDKKEAAAPISQQPKKTETPQPQLQVRKPLPAPVTPQPRKIEPVQVQPQPNKTHVQQKTVEQNVLPQDAQKPVVQKTIIQRPLGQRPLGQRPLKFTTPRTQEVAPVLPPVDVKSIQITATPIVDSLQKDDAQAEVSQSKRPRRRRRYGYRSKAPIQWGKSEDDSELQASDERHDSE